MKKLAGALSALALLVAAGTAVAQTKAPGQPAQPVDAKFVAADADKSGFLEGKELDSYKEQVAKLDANKDGKVSPQEFDMGLKTGLIK